LSDPHTKQHLEFLDNSLFPQLAGSGGANITQIENRNKKRKVSILLTNNDEIHRLNLEYRGKNKPTNVLSFPNLSEDELRSLPKNPPYPIMLGDLALAFETLLEESTFEKKPFLDHFNYLIVHDMLHLLG
jgi:probable rRNA maturation factor